MWKNRSVQGLLSSHHFLALAHKSLVPKSQSVMVGCIPISLSHVNRDTDGSSPALWTQEERLNNEKAKVITGSFPFIIIRLLLGRSVILLIFTLLIWPCWPRLTWGQKASSVCTFSARASSSVPSAVSVFEVSVCKDLTLSFRPLSCFSLSFSWSWRFSIYIKNSIYQMAWNGLTLHCLDRITAITHSEDRWIDIVSIKI